MKIFIDNEGREMDAPSPAAPCQSLEERMGSDKPLQVVAGPLSDEHKQILSQVEAVDRRDFGYEMFHHNFQRAFAPASGSLDDEVNELCKSFGKQAVRPEVRIERDQLDDGSWSVSEYDLGSGALLRAYISKDGEPPAAMR